MNTLLFQWWSETLHLISLFLIQDLIFCLPPQSKGIWDGPITGRLPLLPAFPSILSTVLKLIFSIYLESITVMCVFFLSGPPI